MSRIEQSCLLHDLAAVLDHADLPPRLVFDRLADEADRVEILDLTARAERRAGLAHRDIHIGAQIALLHVAIAGAEIPEDGAHLAEKRLGLVRRAQIRFAHDLHQRHAGAIEIDQRHGGMLVVQQFPGVLLEMKPLDADADRRAVSHIDHDFALADDRRLYWLI